MIRPFLYPALYPAFLTALIQLFASQESQAQVAFSYHAPGDLAVGSGRHDRTVYFPGIQFPLLVGPSANNAEAFANSQIHPPASPYTYPWRDTYCELRGWSMPLRPTTKGHQGVDVRPFKPNENNKWQAVAMDDGVVTAITPFTAVTIRFNQNFYCRYLHLDRASIDAAGLKVGQQIKKGALVGNVSNIMGGTPDTTIHLHFDCYKTINGQTVRLPVYTSLISAYRVAWGMDAGNDSGMLRFDRDRELPFASVVPSATEVAIDLPISFRTRNYGAITPQTEPASWPRYICSWPNFLPNDICSRDRNITIRDAIRDRFNHIVPAFSTDEAGIGFWWYWMVIRGGFGRNGNVTFEQIALKYAGTEDTYSSAVEAYLSDLHWIVTADIWTFRKKGRSSSFRGCKYEVEARASHVST